MTDKENEHTEQLTLRTIWNDYKDSTGFHAVNKIEFGRKYSLGRSIFWITIWLLSAGYLTFIVSSEVMNYYTYPTTISTTKRMAEELEFPAITICNLSSRNKSKITNDTRNNIYYQYLYNKVFYNKLDWSDPFYESEGYDRNRTMQDLYDESKNLSMFVTYTRFDLKDNAFIFKPVATDLGLCIRGDLNETKITKMFGGVYNLQLYIDLLLNDDYYSSIYLSSGIKVAVHDKTDEVILANDGFVVPPASEVFVEISREEYKYLPYPYKAFDNDVCEEAHDNYSESKCLMDCIRSHVMRNCSCVDFMFQSSDGTYCSKKQLLECFAPTYWTFLQNGLRNCQCPIKCHYTSYTTSATFGKFPSEFNINDVCLVVNRTADYVRENYISLRIFYKDLKTTVTEQRPKYENAGDLFSNLGGQMGLFLGASILTLTELFEFFLFVIWYFAVHLTNRKVMVSSDKKLHLSNKAHVDPK